MPHLPFIDVPGAIAEIQAGRMVVVVDDEDRENEGDLTLAAEFVTPEAINFMARYGRGLICLALTEERADYLRLPPMSQENTSRFGTAFTESIEAREGVTTGISAADRAHTIRTAVADGARPEDLITPGHVFPLRAKPGGVLVRTGHTGRLWYAAAGAVGGIAAVLIATHLFGYLQFWADSEGLSSLLIAAGAGGPAGALVLRRVLKPKLQAPGP